MGERRDVWGVQNSAVFVRHTGKCVKCLRAADDTFVRTGAHNELEQNRGSQKERLNKRKDKQIRGQPKNSIVVRCRHAIHSVQVSWKSSQSHFFLRKSRSQLVWRQAKFQTIRRRREKLDWQGSHPIMTTPFPVYACIPDIVTLTLGTSTLTMLMIFKLWFGLRVVQETHHVVTYVRVYCLHVSHLRISQTQLSAVIIWSCNLTTVLISLFVKKSLLSCL